MPYTYTSEQFLPFPIDLVFAFFANPENLPRLMPAWQKARIEEASFAPPPPHPHPERRIRGIAAGQGTRMTISFRPFPYSPLRLPWEAEITHFAWNSGFSDTQLRGPFASWNHTHTLTEETRDRPGTLLRDTVIYDLPVPAIAKLLQPLAALQLASIFRYRQKRTAELLPLMAASLGRSNGDD